MIRSNHTHIARMLRGQPTEAEKRLWLRLRGRQLEGFKFRRQHPIDSYIVDFINLEKRIVIEVDGGQHATDKEADRKRDDWLISAGFKILRFWNNEVFENIEGVLEVIRNALLCSPSGLLDSSGMDGEVSPSDGQ